MRFRFLKSGSCGCVKTLSWQRSLVNGACFLVLVTFVILAFISTNALIAAETGSETEENGLVKFQIINLIHSKSIQHSLSGKPGNPKRGEALMVNRKKGNCIACHGLDVFAEKAKTKPNIYADMGEIGPSLNGIAGRYQEGELRLLLVDAKQIFPDTIMPAFYRIERFTRVDDPFLNKPILKPQEIEDILSFLMKQK